MSQTVPIEYLVYQHYTQVVYLHVASRIRRRSFDINLVQKSPMFYKVASDARKLREQKHRSRPIEMCVCLTIARHHFFLFYEDTILSIAVPTTGGISFVSRHESIWKYTWPISQINLNLKDRISIHYDGYGSVPNARDGEEHVPTVLCIMVYGVRRVSSTNFMPPAL